MSHNSEQMRFSNSKPAQRWALEPRVLKVWVCGSDMKVKPACLFSPQSPCSHVCDALYIAQGGPASVALRAPVMSTPGGIPKDTTAPQNFS